VGDDEEEDVWSKHARHLKHNPATEDDDAAADEQPAKKDKVDAKAKHDKPKSTKARKTKPATHEKLLDDSEDEPGEDPGQTVIDMHVKADANADTMVDGHPILHPMDRVNSAMGEDEAPAEDEADEREDDDRDGDDTPEFKPLA